MAESSRRQRGWFAYARHVAFRGAHAQAYHTDMHAYVHACIRTCMHTYMHAYTRTYIRTCVCARACVLCMSSAIHALCSRAFDHCGNLPALHRTRSADRRATVARAAVSRAEPSRSRSRAELICARLDLTHPCCLDTAQVAASGMAELVSVRQGNYEQVRTQAGRQTGAAQWRMRHSILSTECAAERP